MPSVTPVRGSEALAAGRRILPVGEWRRFTPEVTINDWGVIVIPGNDLRWGEFWVDDEARYTYVGESTWETMSYGAEARHEFFEAATEGSGMKRMVSDAGKYRAAALAEAKAKGLDVPAPKDVLSDLLEQARGLVVQAASLNAGATPLQLESFAMRLAEIRERMGVVEERVNKLRETIDLAELAVLDAAS